MFEPTEIVCVKNNEETSIKPWITQHFINKGRWAKEREGEEFKT